jgi:hypothetical protein
MARLVGISKSRIYVKILCDIHELNGFIQLHVRYPWQHDVGALSRNNGIVQHSCVSLVTQQYWTALASLADNNVNKQHCYGHWRITSSIVTLATIDRRFHGYGMVVFELRLI